MIRRIDPIGRVAYGALCISAMATLALPLLLVAGVAGGIVFALDGEWLKALSFWLLSWASAAFATTLSLGIFYTAWPLASDWITEWPGYAMGFAVAGVGLALMALLVFVVPLPIYASVIGPMAATFAVGFSIASRLGGLGAPSARPRQRAVRRR